MFHPDDQHEENKTNHKRRRIEIEGMSSQDTSFQNMSSQSLSSSQEENEFHQVVWKSEPSDNFYYEGSDVEEEDHIPDIQIKEEKDHLVDVDIMTYFQCHHCQQNFLSLEKLEEHVQKCQFKFKQLSSQNPPKLPSTMKEKLENYRSRLIESLENQRQCKDNNNKNILPPNNNIVPVDTSIISNKLEDYKNRLINSLVSQDDKNNCSFNKPKITYPSLATLAIRNSDTEKLTIPQIWTFLCTHFPFFNTVGKKFRNGTTSCNSGLRNALTKTVNCGFLRYSVPNAGKPPSVYWTLDPVTAHQMDEALGCDMDTNPEELKKCMANPDDYEALRNYTFRSS